MEQPLRRNTRLPLLRQVEALILIEPNMRGYVPATMSSDGQARMVDFFSYLTGATAEERLQQFIEAGLSRTGYAPPADRPEARERQRTIVTENSQRLLTSMQEPGWLERHNQAWLDPSAFGRLGRIRVPTLMVVREPLGPDAQQYVYALSQAIAGAKVVVMPSAWSPLNLEQPQAVNRLILDFLADTRPGRKPPSAGA